MIPVLYEEDETRFTSEGLGRLVDCTECIVTEERNGIYECEFSYPVTGALHGELYEGRIIYADHDESGEGQPFVIYARSEPIDGIVTYNAHHISYRLSNEVAMPYTAASAYNAFAFLPGKIVGGTEFTFSTDKTTFAFLNVDKPTTVRGLLAGEEGSILDAFGGGEYLFDKFDVKLLERRGEDTSVEVRYGKNLVDYEHTIDVSETYDAMVPYWYQEPAEGELTGTVVTLPEVALRHEDGTKYMAVDLTDKFAEQPTVAQLRSAAESYFTANRPWLPSEGFSIDFAALWQTAEYAQYAPLEQVKLCDTVLVYYPDYGIEAVREKIVKTVYNTLLDRYDELTLNELPTTFSGILS